MKRVTIGQLVGHHSELIQIPIARWMPVGTRVVSRRTPLGYVYDVVLPPLEMEDILPEELL